jgi:phosphoglycolate phosphatase
MKKIILFDLDGTLTDSGAGIMHGMEIVLSYYGLPVPDRQALRVIVGPPLRGSFLRFGVKQEDLDEAVAVYRKFYVAEGKYENFVYPGIENLLKHLSKEGCRLFVATSKPEKMAQEILEHFGLAHYFEKICGAAEDRSRDTKTKVIQYLMNQIDKDMPIMMVGDTFYDVEGAAALGIPTIGVSWGYGEIQDMLTSGAVGIAEDAEELKNLLLA